MKTTFRPLTRLTFTETAIELLVGWTPSDVEIQDGKGGTYTARRYTLTAGTRTLGTVTKERKSGWFATVTGRAFTHRVSSRDRGIDYIVRQWQDTGAPYSWYVEKGGLPPTPSTAPAVAAPQPAPAPRKRGTAPGCDRHRQAPAAGCAICQRIGVEFDILTRTIHALCEAGYLLQIDNGEDAFPVAGGCRDRLALIEAAMQTDEERLYVYRDHDHMAFGWVFFVYGNDGWDVINDYTTNLESALAEVNAYADTLQ